MKIFKFKMKVYDKCLPMKIMMDAHMDENCLKLIPFQINIVTFAEHTQRDGMRNNNFAKFLKLYET